MIRFPVVCSLLLIIFTFTSRAQDKQPANHAAKKHRKEQHTVAHPKKGTARKVGKGKAKARRSEPHGHNKPKSKKKAPKAVKQKPAKKKIPVLAASKGKYTGDGFRVQIYNGTDRYKAQKIRDEFDLHYPGVHTYMSYVAPHYRIKVGDYKNRQDAMGMYKEASSSYFPCMIVPDKVVIK